MNLPVLCLSKRKKTYQYLGPCLFQGRCSNKKNLFQGRTLNLYPLKKNRIPYGVHRDPAPHPFSRPAMAVLLLWYEGTAGAARHGTAHEGQSHAPANARRDPGRGAPDIRSHLSAYSRISISCTAPHSSLSPFPRSFPNGQKVNAPAARPREPSPHRHYLRFFPATAHRTASFLLIHRRSA